MIQRNKYLNELLASKQNGFPKVITGIRRCGKSYLLKEIYKSYLLSKGVKESHILILDLDEDKNAKYRDPIFLGEYVRSLCKDDECHYVFLDEIQRVYSLLNPALTGGKHVLAKKDDKEVVSFVDVVLGLSHESNIDLYVTGSNSKMLSTDIITQFRDRATNIHLTPLSFVEYYGYAGGSTNDALADYMRYGGMPLAVLKNPGDKETYLMSLFETTYFKDILDHNGLKKSEALDELCDLLSSMTGEFLNAEKIANTYQSVAHRKIDRDTVEKYVSFFEDAFLLQEARRYDLKGRREIGSLKKYYFTDVGLRNARLNFSSPDEGQILENVVYNSLISEGYSVSIGQFDTVEKNKEGRSVRKTNEIDFFAEKGLKRYYIQVTDNLADAKTRNREISPFLKLRNSIQKVLVVNRPLRETIDENGLILIGASDFLLRFIQ